MQAVMTIGQQFNTCAADADCSAALSFACAYAVVVFGLVCAVGQLIAHDQERAYTRKENRNKKKKGPRT